MINFAQIPNDTSADEKEMQIKLLREAGQEKRSRLMLSLTQSAFSLSRHNLKLKYPELSELERNIKFVEYLYGAELAVALKDYLNSRAT